tara:strand:+ start:12672 stop:13556 length:885 start_codon:yes stop_codon:yes gene_type:complete
MRILVTGASGMLGSTLAVILSKNHDVFGTGNSKTSLPIKYLKFNLLNNSYKKVIDWARPELIIHCAAITDGNYCESNPEEAFSVNGISVSKFLKHSDQSVKFIYISTDAVFPSSLNYANENDSISPENIYGKSKELGEFFIKRALNRSYTIIRTTIVGVNEFSNKTSFVEWILNSVNANKKIGLFSDVLFSPISIWNLSFQINYLIDSKNINSETLHISGEACSKYKFGLELLKAFNIDSSKVKKSSILNFKKRAKRSQDQSLNSNLYKRKYKMDLPNLSTTISEIKKYYHEEN